MLMYQSQMMTRQMFVLPGGIILNPGTTTMKTNNKEIFRSIPVSKNLYFGYIFEYRVIRNLGVT